VAYAELDDYFHNRVMLIWRHTISVGRNTIQNILARGKPRLRQVRRTDKEQRKKEYPKQLLATA
jgi:hypothetical protein